MVCRAGSWRRTGSCPEGICSGLGGGFGLLGEQVLALASVIAFSFVATWLIATAIERTIGLRGAPDEEDHRDESQQGMNAYDSEAFATPRSTAAVTSTSA